MFAEQTQNVSCPLFPDCFFATFQAANVLCSFSMNKNLISEDCYISYILIHVKGSTRWYSWLRHYATSRKVTGSIPDGVTGIFRLHNPSGRTIVLGNSFISSNLIHNSYINSVKLNTSTCFGVHPPILRRSMSLIIQVCSLWCSRIIKDIDLLRMGG